MLEDALDSPHLGIEDKEKVRLRPRLLAGRNLLRDILCNNFLIFIFECVLIWSAPFGRVQRDIIPVSRDFQLRKLRTEV